MKLSRKFAEILSSHSTVRRNLLRPAVVLESSLYSTSSSSKPKSKYTKKQEKVEPEVLELGNEVHENQGFLQYEPTKAATLSHHDWPKPKEIPYQPRIANSVNLIGSIAKFVKLAESPDGKYFSGAILTQETPHDSSSLLIPIIFEGDLAKTAACHLKEKDLVHVEGHLSGDPPQLSMEHGHDHFSVQVMVRNISLVENPSQGKEGYTPYKQGEQASMRTANTKKDWASSESSWRDVIDNPKMWSDYRKAKLNGSVKPKHPDFKHKDNGVPLWLNSAPQWVMSELQTTTELQPTTELQITTEKAGSWSNFPKNSEGSFQRNSKEKLESWKNLVENPVDWWDNRSNKLNKKAPDFKHKKTGEALWLNDSPAWVQDMLPPVKPEGIATHKRDTLLS